MKILLISIDLVLGTRILINVLKGQNFEVHNLQIVGIKYSDDFTDEVLQDIYDFVKGYEIVGLSFNSFYSLLAARLGNYLKEKGIKWVISGGPHVTVLPEEVITFSDVAVIHEAELTMPKLLRSLFNNEKSFSNVNGIVFKDGNGKIVNTGYPKLETNLDNIPFQSFCYEDITYYDFSSKTFKKPTIDNLFPHGGRNYFIVTSRGCPFKCTYCCNNLFAKVNKDFMKVRKRSVDNIISEMRKAKDFGFKGFYIADDNFLTFTLDEIKNFSKLYKSSIQLPFGVAGINPNNMRAIDSAKKIELLLNAGLSDVRIGVQSGSNKTLKIFNRKYTAEELPGLVKIFENRKTIWKGAKNKLRVAVDFICDAPWETEKDKVDTIKLANNLLPTYGIFFYTLVYLPGTDIYELSLKKGWVNNRERDIYLRGIAGVDDNIYNRLLFLVAILKERGVKLPDEIIFHILDAYRENPSLSEKLINFVIKVINDVESHHGFNLEHLTLHPYLKGFNKWEKTVGQRGRKVLFRSYHEPYG